MKAAVVSFTANGARLSRRIAEASDVISADRYCFRKRPDEGARSFGDLGELTADIFTKYEALIFVCACGIAVRAIAPNLRSKTTDPAVLVIDDRGENVVPILSGHLGGANALALRLAGYLGARAVITTATDVGGRFSPDSFAKANGLIVTDTEAAKAVAASVLDGERVGFVSEYEYVNLPEDVSEGSGGRVGIYVGKGGEKPFPVTLGLVPKNIVLGVGCKRGSSAEAIESAVFSALKDADIPLERVFGAATIDLKSDEEGLLRFCDKYGLRLFAYSAEELAEVSGDFASSDFVKSVAGVDNVCERSAVKLSGGSLVLRKTALNGVTVAAAEKPVELDFERRIL